MIDEYEGRIASLRTGIKMVLENLEPSFLSNEQKIELAKKCLEALLDSDLDKSLAFDRTTLDGAGA